jgi:hypothetical protein
VYSKDDQISANEDAAWIDYIEFPPGNPTGSTQSLYSQRGQKTTWKLFPNPGNGAYWLENSTLHAGNVEITLFDCLGKKIQSWNRLSTGEALFFTIDPVVESGLYFLQINTGDCSEMVRLVHN